MGSMPMYAKILLENSGPKPYTEFLKWLIEKKFFKDVEEKVPIKKMAADFKSDSAKVTKWIKDIYQGIFELNDEKPEIFQRDGEFKVRLIARYFDSSCSFALSLPVLPREFEQFNFYFFRGVVGTDYFWVKKIQYDMEDDQVNILVWLEAGFVNKYREFALDKALFQGWIGSSDVYHKYPYELDKELKNLYKD